MASTYLTRTQGTATDRKKFTLSMWVKLAKTGSQLSSFQFMDFYGGGSDRISFYSNTDDQLQIYHEKQNSGTNEVAWKTDAKLRDLNAFYHIVWRADSTQSTASDRFRVYINGELASLNTTTYPSQNFEWAQGTSSYTQYVGKYGGHNTNNFDGIMSHIHFCDGYSYGADSFGSTDSVTGQWKINPSPSITMGNNGFTILKDGNTITDQSSNSNDFTLGGGTLTNTEDSPSNVFATLNPLDLGDTTNIATLSNGNNYYSSTQGGYNMMVTTLGANSGKWYWEAKYISHNMHGNSDNFGINPGFTGDRIPIGTNTSYLGKTANSYVFQDAGLVYNNDATTTYASGATNANNLNDIVGIALDLDNNKAYYHVNGTYWNSANPSNGTGGLSINPASQTETGFYFPSISDKSSVRSYVYAFNFGNGYFGTTAISSEGTNASGIGKFEYDVPSGFTALSTKGLNL